MSNNTLEFRPSGSIEFEQVQVASVPQTKPAAPADDGIDRDPLSIHFGRLKDSKPTPAERMLAGFAIDWLVAFPADARPKALCERFPWVANRLAKGWPDAAGSTGNLQALVADARWGSSGFPAQVQAELQAVLRQVGAAPAVKKR